MIRSTALLVLLMLMALTLGQFARASAEAAAVAPPPSAFLPLYQTGVGWAEDEYTTDLAFGDVDGDGRDETLIARRAAAGPRLLLVDDAMADFALLHTFGEGWGVLAWPTAVAFGNVDDDPAAELAVARSTSVNERVQVFDDAAAGFASLGTFGEAWSSTVYAVSVAFGDVDGDGRDELGVATNAGEAERAFVFDDVAAGFDLLGGLGEAWGAGATATDIAFGDADGDGDDEIALSRDHDVNARFFVHDGAPAFELLWEGGETWGAGSFATGVAFGNVDGDPALELGVARRASLNERAYVFDDAGAGFATLQLLGQTWPSNAWATSIAFGDVDGDGRDEVGLARVATVNSRVFVYDDAAPDGDLPAFDHLWGGAGEWPGPEYATVVVFGNVDATAEAELGLGRLAAAGPRVFVLSRGWVDWVPFLHR
jgi:hypothetical protein